MKILYNIAGTYRSGGMERVLTNKANYLVKQGYEVTIVTTDQRGQLPFFPLDKRIKCVDLGINYEENNGRSIWNKIIHYPFKQYKHKRLLEDVLNTEKPDITISMFCNEVSFIAELNDDSKKVLEIHFSKFKRLQYGRSGLWRLIDLFRTKQDERLVKQFDKFIVLTEEDKGYWGELSNIEVIPNARTFAPNVVSTLESHKVTAIGRYTYQKGFDRLIEAWNLIKKDIEDWTLDIVGSGEDREQLQSLIDKYELQDSVTLVEPTQNIEQIYLGSSIIAMSSRYEGLPMILLEAQTYGLPVVSFRCKCGPADVIEHGESGLLVEEGDIYALAESLKLLIENETLRKSMGGIARTNSEKYSEESVMKRWCTLFDELA